jgi:transcriptional antiterminator NusG
MNENATPAPAGDETHPATALPPHDEHDHPPAAAGAPQAAPEAAPEVHTESLPEPATETTPVAADVHATPVVAHKQPPAEPTPTPEHAPEPPAEIAAETAPEAPPAEAAAEPTPEAKPAKPRAKRKTAAAAAEEAAPEAAAAPPAADGTPPPDSKKKWYVVKVQSGREESIKSAVERKVKIEGLEEFFGQIAIPTESVTEVKKVRVTDKKTGEKVTQEKRVSKERKKFHGYIFAEVEFNDRILYLFRETSGVGDFVGATPTRPPTPMTDREVQAMLHGIIDKADKKKGGKTVVKLDYEKGDKVRVREGAFANMEGEVKSITEPKDPSETPKVTVVVSIFGRPVDVEVDYWQVDKV